MLALLTTVIVAGGVLLFVPGRYDAVATASIDPGNVDPISETPGAAPIMLVKGVDPKFNMGTNFLAIKYKSGDPNQAALIANAFLASTIDGSVALKAAEADQTAQWFAPQLD